MPSYNPGQRKGFQQEKKKLSSLTEGLRIWKNLFSDKEKNPRLEDLLATEFT